MRNYPIDSEQKGFIAMHTAIQMINAAFFDGFMTALLETPEELDTMTINERIMYCAFAAKRNAYITRNAVTPFINELVDSVSIEGITV